MSAVRQTSGGGVEFQHFPSEQLGKNKDVLILAQTGVIDIGYLVPSYQSDRMPLSAALELPGVLPDYCEGLRTLWSLTHDGGYLEEKEFAPNHIIPLITFVPPPYQLLLSSSKRIGSIKDLRGLKIRSAGGAMDFVLTGMGMIPVRMTAGEVYEGLSRGTIDGALLSYLSAVSYHLGPLLTRGTVSAHFGTVVITYAIGERRWNQLPETTKAVLMNAGRETSVAVCEKALAAEKQSFDTLTAEGMQPLTLAPEDEKRLALEFANVAQEWAASVDKRGRAGRDTLAAVRRAAAASAFAAAGRPERTGGQEAGRVAGS